MSNFSDYNYFFLLSERKLRSSLFLNRTDDRIDDGDVSDDNYAADYDYTYHDGDTDVEDEDGNDEIDHGADDNRNGGAHSEFDNRYNCDNDEDNDDSDDSDDGDNDDNSDDDFDNKDED